jgi:hypothetical protein
MRVPNDLAQGGGIGSPLLFCCWNSPPLSRYALGETVTSRSVRRSGCHCSPQDVRSTSVNWLRGPPQMPNNEPMSPNSANPIPTQPRATPTKAAAKPPRPTTCSRALRPSFTAMTDPTMLRGPTAHATTNVNADGLPRDKIEITTHGPASAAAPSTAARTPSQLPSAIVGEDRSRRAGFHGRGSASWGSPRAPWKRNPHMGQERAGLISRPQPGHLMRSMANPCSSSSERQRHPHFRVRIPPAYGSTSPMRRFSAGSDTRVRVERRVGFDGK